MGAAQLRPGTEIALPQSFLWVKRSSIQYVFRGGAKAIPYSVIIASINNFLSRTYYSEEVLKFVTS